MSAQYEILPPGGHETYAEKIFRKIKSYVENKVQTDVPSNAVFTDKKATYYGVTSNNQNVTGTVDRLWFIGNDFVCDPAATTTREDCIISLRYPNLVKQSPNDSTDAEYRILFSNTADDTERIEKVQKDSGITYNPLKSSLKIGTSFSSGGVTGSRDTTIDTHGIKISEYVGSSLYGQLELQYRDIFLDATWDGTHTSLKDTITYLGSQSAVNKVDKSGDTMSGALNFSGSDIYLKTANSSSDDSGDIVFYYGNGYEKSRIWTDNGYTASMGPNYRVYKKDGTALYNGRLATLGDLSWGNISGKPSTFPPSSHSHSYLPLTGGTLTGALTFANGTKNTVGDDVAIGDINRGGGLAIQGLTGDTNIYFVKKGNAWKNGATGNYAMTWNGSLMSFSGHTQVGGVLRVNAISRTDTGDNGYVNHVNPDNNAYRPVRASAFTTMSCKHTKTNVVDISEEDARKLLNIRPVNFDYVEEVGGQKDQIGVLAEDTYEVLPKVVSVPDDYVEEDFDVLKGIHQPLPSVDYAKFVPYLIKMVQIQQREIDELRADVQSIIERSL